MSSSQATSSSFPFANPDLARTWMDLKLPSLTAATLIEAQHKNAAAIGNANQVIFDGLKTLLHRQGFLLTASVETGSRVTRDFLAAQSFEERAAKQADAARDTYFSVVARMRELSDIVIEANMAAIGIVNARIIEAFGDFRALFAPPVAAPAPSEALAPAPALPPPPATAVEEAATVEQAIIPAEPALPPVITAPQVAPEAAAVEEEAIAASTTVQEPVEPEPEVAPAPPPPPKSAAPAAKPAAPPARTTVPKAPPPRPPRRPTSRG